MVIYDKNVSSIELEDINNLITEKVAEDKFLERNNNQNMEDLNV